MLKKAIMSGTQGRTNQVLKSHIDLTAGMRIRNFFLGSGSGSAEKSDPDPAPTLIRKKKKKLYILMKKNIYIIVTAVHQ